MRAAPYQRAWRAGRASAQTAFMDNEADVVVATVAFGMGDKANVRFVFHRDPSDSVDSLYQEVGRADRDGEHAEATLFFRAEDHGLRRFFAGSGRVGEEEIDAVAEAVAHAHGCVSTEELRERSGLTQAKAQSAVNRLEDAGAVDVRAGGEVVATAAGGDPREAVDAAVRAQERREALEASRLEMMRSYAELRDGCRREFVLNYFGEDYRGPCGRCENCEAGRMAERRGDELPFDVGSRVAHREWGGGVVHGFDDGRVTVLFDEVRYRTLALELVEARDLLAAEEA